MWRKGTGVCVEHEGGRGGRIVVYVVRGWHDSDSAVVGINEGSRDTGERPLGAEIIEIRIAIVRGLSCADESLFSNGGRKRLALFAGRL